MKKLWTLICLLTCVSSAFAQDYTMISSGIYTTCSGNFYDSGGPSGNYNANQNTVVTFYPATPGEMVSVTFSSFITYGFADELYVYNGNSISTPRIAYLNGSVAPGTITSTATDGSLTFKFVSNTDNNVAAGWAASISCVPLYSMPVSGNINMISSGTYQTCSGNFYDSGGPSGNYNANQNTVVTFYPFCNTDKISVTFSYFITYGFADELYVYNGNNISAPQIAYLNGNVAPGTITSTATDGSLTFKFVSNTDNNVADGWAASIASTLPVGGIATASPPSVCSGNSTLLTLTGYSGCQLQWQSSPDGSSWSDIIGNTLPTMSTGPLTSNTFYQALVNNLCSDASSNIVTVTVHPNPDLPTILWSWPNLECTPNSGYQYEWNYNSGTNSLGSNNSYIPSQGNGNYTVTITDNNGCYATSAPYSFFLTNIAGNTISDFSIYPNPSNGSITLETTLAISGTLQTEIKNTLGETVYSNNEKASCGTYKKNIEVNLAPGIYYLSLETNEGRTTKKIEIVK